ncbi:MAG: hypothetical protein CL685_02225 [Candidatus Magasanikbacteria bacterium]|nr:hypothetical protein [Candidatus Magasanikbacteria bacterium]
MKYIVTSQGISQIIIMVLLACFTPISPVFAQDHDTDNDGLSNILEEVYHTDPYNPDTDGDGFFDGVEIAHDYSPHQGNGAWMHESDYDDDGLNDWLERWFGSDIGQIDTDGDGYNDFVEVSRGYDPKDIRPIIKYSKKVEVDRTAQRLYYYVDGVKIENWPVSTGNPHSPTPEGEFTITTKIPKKRYSGPGYDLPGVEWNMKFKPLYYIHGAYWHNDFGQRTRSHGCVNMRTADAKKLYSYIDIGVPVSIIGNTPKHAIVGS